MSQCTAQMDEVRCQEPEGHDGNHMRTWHVGGSLVPSIMAWGQDACTARPPDSWALCLRRLNHEGPHRIISGHEWN